MRMTRLIFRRSRTTMVASLHRSGREEHHVDDDASTTEGPFIGPMSPDETFYFEHYVLPVRMRSAESPSPDGQETLEDH